MNNIINMIKDIDLIIYLFKIFININTLTMKIAICLWYRNNLPDDLHIKIISLRIFIHNYIHMPFNCSYHINKLKIPLFYIYKESSY